jgi:hypothetical protein
MTANDIIRHRLHQQQLERPSFTKAGDVVSWLGAVQAQDYLGVLWSVGQRVKKAAEPDVEKAIADKTVVRTWPMRGTLHFVSPKDVRWMLKYLTPRVFSRMAGMLKKEGIDGKVLLKSKKRWIKALEGGKRLTRDEMYQVLEDGKISTADTRGLHLLACMAQEGVICFGPRKGKQQTFTLLDEWLPSYPMLTREEALRELALRYFTSHGPATIEDFMWWAGLTKADATIAINEVKPEVTSAIISGKTYWLSPHHSVTAIDAAKAYLLPTFDEYGIAYKDRSAIISSSDYKKVGGQFMSAIVIKGKIAGVWRRTFKNEDVVIEAKPFGNFSKADRLAVDAAAGRYSNFIGKNYTLLY